MLKKILIPLLISLIQIVGLAVIHDVAYHYFPMHHRSIGFGLTIRYTGAVFIVLITTFNLYLSFIRKHKYLIGLLFLIITSIIPIMALDYRPWRVLFLIILALGGYLSSIMISIKKD